MINSAIKSEEETTILNAVKNPTEVKHALGFLRALDSTTNTFCFRTFDDVRLNDGKSRGNTSLARKISGNLKQAVKELRELNDKGAGIFVVINKGGQKKSEITEIRAVFADTDGAPLEPLLALKPHIVVESSKDNWHAYWLVHDCSLEQFSLLQTGIAERFNTDPSVKDLPRVMRLPGFNHNKRGAYPSRIIIYNPDLAKYSVKELSEGLGLRDLDNIIESNNLSQNLIVSSAYFNKFKLEKLGAQNSNVAEPYGYEENRETLYSALCAAFPDPSNNKDWLKGVQALAYLVCVMQWPENEARLIKEQWENLALSKHKIDITENERQWLEHIKRTPEYIKSGNDPTTHLSILKIARANGWHPKVNDLDALSTTQQKFALISLGGKVGIVDKQRLNSSNSDGSATQLVVMNKPDGGLLVSRFLASKFNQVDPQKMLTTFFRDKNTTLYDGVEFNPENTTPNVLNLWVGETVKPVKGKWHLVYTLLHEILCGGRESEYQYLIKYIAHALQRPWEKPGVMIILLGGQGIGKGTLAKILQRIWSATFLQVNRIKHVVGDFNGALERAFIVFLDEALFVGDRNSSDALKSLVTEQTISINEKHQPTRQITSYHRFFSATNSDWFKSTERDDRRDFVLRVSEHRKGDYAFWNALNSEIENGGVEAFAHDLLATDLTGFNIRAKPNTRELTEQKLQSLEKYPRWWFSVLSRGYIHENGGDWPEFISTATLLSAYQENDKNLRSYKSIIERDIAGLMIKMCPSAAKGRSKEGLHRRHGFMLPSVYEARNDFEKYIGDEVTWDEIALND